VIVEERSEHQAPGMTRTLAAPPQVRITAEELAERLAADPRGRLVQDDLFYLDDLRTAHIIRRPS
jgi:hypothetical protein